MWLWLVLRPKIVLVKITGDMGLSCCVVDAAAASLCANLPSLQLLIPGMLLT